MTSAGPKDRAGFIEAPLMGLDQSPARMMWPPQPRVPNRPQFGAPEAVTPPGSLGPGGVGSSAHRRRARRLPVDRLAATVSCAHF